jgi:hypothetical protein
MLQIQPVFLKYLIKYNVVIFVYLKNWCFNRNISLRCFYFIATKTFILSYTVRNDVRSQKQAYI